MCDSLAMCLSINVLTVNIHYFSMQIKQTNLTITYCFSHNGKLYATLNSIKHSISSENEVEGVYGKSMMLYQWKKCIDNTIALCAVCTQER